MLQEELIQPIVDIPESELKLRREKIIRGFEAEDCRAMVFFSAKSVFYLTGCQFQFTERACALILQEDGSMQMMLPKVEYTFAQKVACGVSDYLVYEEYPGEIHPMRRFSDYLIRLGLGTGRIAAESDGYPMIWGYRGPKLSSLNSALQLVFLPTLVEDAQLIKT